MADKNLRSSPDASIVQEELDGSSIVQKELNQLKVYAVITFTSLGVFVMFAIVLVGVHLLSNLWPQFGILKIVAWPLTVVGMICCIATSFKSAWRFLKFLFRKQK